MTRFDEARPRGGPRTPEGKQRSSQNARKHGLSSITLAAATSEELQLFHAQALVLQDQIISSLERELVALTEQNYGPNSQGVASGLLALGRSERFVRRSFTKRRKAALQNAMHCDFDKTNSAE